METNSFVFLCFRLGLVSFPYLGIVWQLIREVIPGYNAGQISLQAS